MRVALLAMAVCLAGYCQVPGDLAEYRARRAELAKALPDGVVVLFARGSGEGRGRYFQEPNFAYLTGWRRPGAVLLLAPGLEILFLPPRDERTETYEGPMLTAEDPRAREITGFDRVLPTTHLERELRAALEERPRIYTALARPEAERLRALAPLRQISDVRPSVARLRARKSPGELDRIRRSIQVTIEAHRAAWKRLAPGIHEYQIAATLVGTFLERGCEDAAYAPIVASGPNALILHYEQNARRMEAGELLLVDAGASCEGYAADLTRTVPVNGRFTPRQRELYEAVLGALKAVIASIRPGVLLGGRANNVGLQKIARDYLDAQGRDGQGRPLGAYFVHGIGHRVGLEVHDAHQETMNLPLEPGDVVAIEPGLYLKEEGVGIRIEDMVLVTEQGAVVLSEALPREVADIERELAAARSASRQ
ncbi:MAG: Xaa-Pro peptidase family protein [Bryobacterales bacterium]|nr:Xaa-Pro peptidase family protein [Bryobacteraceae bacterium]MDW8131635.1 Xaa-Pro peptidase family protein [Bryobacterales bacterium]